MVGVCECAVYRPVLTAGVPLCEVSLCKLFPSVIPFGQEDAVSDVARKGNTVSRAWLACHPSVCWKTFLRPFHKTKEKVVLNEE